MKRAGFTMIELIFVIVILGILASVAVPKLIGVKDSADEGLVKGFVGTLNRTVGPSKWSQSLMNDDDGALRNNGGTYDIEKGVDTDFPADLKDLDEIDVSACTTNGTGVVATGTAWKLYCMDGNESNSPRFFYSDHGVSATAGQISSAVDSGEIKIQ